MKSLKDKFREVTKDKKLPESVIEGTKAKPKLVREVFGK